MEGLLSTGPTPSSLVLIESFPAKLMVQGHFHKPVKYLYKPEHFFMYFLTSQHLPVSSQCLPDGLEWEIWHLAV